MELPETDIKCTLTFSNPSQANEFAKMYTRKTLMGHSVGGCTVTVWNVTEEIKQWIDSYAKALNEG